MVSFEFSEDSTGDKTATELSPKQLYRSNQSIFPALEMLERTDLTPEDIINFCQAKEPREFNRDSLERECIDQDQVYRRRRKEIRSLLKKVKTGEARVDEDGRLVEVVNPTAPPAIQLPPPPAAPRNPPPQGVGAAPWLDHEEEDREWVAQGEREAAASVARALEQWRNNGVAEEDLVFVQVPPNDDHANLTFRRVCFAVLAVVGAFTAIMLQTLPLSSPAYPNPDKLLSELLHVKRLESHLEKCPGLHRQGNLSQWDRLVEFFGGPLSDDCGDGVLHIPSTRTILDNSLSGSAKHFLLNVGDIVLKGMNHSWFFDCHGIPEDEKRADTKEALPQTCSLEQDCRQCFRGVHDHFLSSPELKLVMEAGARMILQGGDHHDIYRATEVPEKLESIFEKTKEFLQQAYSISGDNIRPVAFRIGAEGAMDGVDGPRSYLKSPTGIRPINLLNLTNYVQYVERVNKRNGYAQYSLPWPLRVQPYRDECNLLADMQVDRRFKIQTMIFLADGGSSGTEFRGGEALYVDKHPSNSRRHKVRRGLVVDGVRGRLIVSTGGLENLRCRLPIRSGVRAALQIWWQD